MKMPKRIFYDGPYPVDELQNARQHLIRAICNVRPRVAAMLQRKVGITAETLRRSEETLIVAKKKAVEEPVSKRIKIYNSDTSPDDEDSDSLEEVQTAPVTVKSKAQLKCDLCIFSCHAASNHVMRSHLSDKGHFSASIARKEDSDWIILDPMTLTQKKNNQIAEMTIVTLCSDCDVPMLNPFMMTQHQRLFHAASQLKQCKGSVTTHIISLPVAPIRCNTCNKRFDTEYHLRKHWGDKESHNPASKLMGRYDKVLYQCSSCNLLAHNINIIVNHSFSCKKQPPRSLPHNGTMIDIILIGISKCNEEIPLPVLNDSVNILEKEHYICLQLKRYLIGIGVKFKSKELKTINKQIQSKKLQLKVALKV